MSKYFVCKNEYEAKAINYITGKRFYKFTESNKTVYTFERDEVVFKAYKIIMDARNKFLN